MAEQRGSNNGWFARWRAHRRAKRQQARERQYFAQEQARSRGGAVAVSATERLNASVTASSYATASSGGWAGLGGDGGDGGC